jgi:hypothetical protein
MDDNNCSITAIITVYKNLPSHGLQGSPFPFLLILKQFKEYKGKTTVLNNEMLCLMLIPYFYFTQ